MATVTQSKSFRYDAKITVEAGAAFRYDAKLTIPKSSRFRYDAKLTTEKSASFRYDAKTQIIKAAPFRYAALITVNQSRDFRYSNTTIHKSSRFRYKAPLVIKKSSKFRYLPLAGGYDNIWKGIYLAVIPPGDLPMNGKAGEGAKFLQGELIVKDGGISYTLFDGSRSWGSTGFSVTYQESQPARWAINIIDPMGYYIHHNSASSWTNIIDDEPYNGDTVAKVVQSNLEWGGQPFDFEGIPLSYNISKVWTDASWNITWSGVDRSHILFRESQSFATIRSSLSNLNSAKTIISQMLSAYGLQSQLEFEDYFVPVMHRQDGRPIDFIKALLEVRGAEWRVDGNTFYAWVPNVTGSYTWDYSFDDVVVFGFSEQSEFEDTTNRVVVTRAVESSRTASTTEGGEVGGGESNPQQVYTYEDFGEYTVTFDEPLTHVTEREVVSNKGTFIDFRYKDASGNVISVHRATQFYAQHLIGAPIYNATSVTFGWHAAPNVLSGSGFGQIMFFGRGQDNLNNAKPPQGGGGGSSSQSNNPTEFDAAYVVEAECTEHINAKGVIKEEIAPSPLIPNSTVAADYATQYLKKAMSGRIKATYQVPLNIALKVGDTIRQKHTYWGLNRVLYVESVTHQFSNDDSETFTTFTARYYDGCSITTEIT